jgi:hypothetical protein
MKDPGFKIYGYRWIVLLAFMCVVAVNQLAWLSFASITSDAAEYYKVSDLSIGLLSMSFMIVYIFVCIPASWAIDTWGIRVGVGIGAALTGVFGLLRGLVSESYALVLVAQIGIAIGQPFINNAVTKVAARWFPLQERATASGLGTLAMYVGMAAGLVLTPILYDQFEMRGMLLAYRRGRVLRGGEGASPHPSLSPRPGRAGAGARWTEADPAEKGLRPAHGGVLCGFGNVQCCHDVDRGCRRAKGFHQHGGRPHGWAHDCGRSHRRPDRAHSL